MEVRLSGFRSLMSCLSSRLCDAYTIRACSRSHAIECIAGERSLHLLIVNFARAKPIADAALVIVSISADLRLTQASAQGRVIRCQQIDTHSWNKDVTRPST